MRLVYCLVSLALLTLPVVGKDKETPTAGTQIATSGDQASSATDQSEELQLVDVFARAILGFVDGGKVDFAGMMSVSQDAPGVYQWSADSSRQRSHFTITEPQSCVFLITWLSLNSQQSERLEFDANALEDITYELAVPGRFEVPEDDDLNRIEVSHPSAEMRRYNEDGTLRPRPLDIFQDLKTSLSLEEMQAAGAALLEACSASEAQPVTEEQEAPLANPESSNLPASSTAKGSQSLLLESDAGQSGAVPFSGTVEWSTGTDESGLPTLIARVNIPGREMALDLLLRKNSNTSLPASHLIEARFHLGASFSGGSIASLSGILLKNEELIEGEALVGASAAVMTDTFVFALSSRPEDVAENNRLLTSNEWIDLSIVYATGKRAIVTLKIDDTAEVLFDSTFALWGQN